MKIRDLTGLRAELRLPSELTKGQQEELRGLLGEYSIDLYESTTIRPAFQITQTIEGKPDDYICGVGVGWFERGLIIQALKAIDDFRISNGLESLFDTTLGVVKKGWV